MFTTTPEWRTSQWLNTPTPLTLEDFAGKVVVLEAFQMLCPGCVSHGLPLLQKVRETFASEDVAVVGLHSVFEHHEAQGHPTALEAFLHEYRIDFPVGIDAQVEGQRLPATMSAYKLQGTPSLVIFDRQGNRRHQHFGVIPELALGAILGGLVAEPVLSAPSQASSCSNGVCAV